MTEQEKAIIFEEMYARTVITGRREELGIIKPNDIAYEDGKNHMMKTLINLLGLDDEYLEYEHKRQGAQQPTR